MLHKRAIMMIFANVTDTASLAASQVVFKIAVESLVLAIVNFEVGKVAADVLGSEGTFFHTD